MNKEKKVVIFVCFKHNGWIKRIATVASYYKNRLGLDVEIMDLEELAFPSFSMAGWEERLRELLTEEIAIRTIPKSSDKGKLESSICCESQMRESVNSTVLTSWGEGLPSRDSFLKKLYKSKLTRSFWQIHNILPDFLAGYEEDTIFVVPNGRLVHESATIASLRHQGYHSISFYEIGLTSDYVYLAETQPLDRDGIRSRLSLVPETKDRNMASKWLDSRISGEDQTNSFARNFLPVREHQQLYDLSLFTSSVDELESYGEQWKADISQIEGFLSIWRQTCNPANSSVAIRVHPNLGNKSVRTFIKEARSLRQFAAKTNADLFGPFSRTNSYELISNSGTVGVYASTVGLEAIYMGKETWISGLPFFVDGINHIADRRDNILVVPAGSSSEAVSYVSKVLSSSLESYSPDLQVRATRLSRVRSIANDGLLQVALRGRLMFSRLVNRFVLSPVFFPVRSKPPGVPANSVL